MACLYTSVSLIWKRCFIYSVEYCVLLHRLFRSGVNGLAWSVILLTYICAQIRIGNNLSQFIKLQHGVRQGSVLSPVLFLLLMDSLLIDLATTEAGILLWVSLPHRRP